VDNHRLNVLLIEDDEDDYILVRSLLAEVSSPTRYKLDWVDSYEAAMQEIQMDRHDVYLLDYRLGERNGLELLHEAAERGCKAPVIFLTGQGDYLVDMEAMKTGAADYLVKGQINGPLLERSIRYAIEHKRAEEALRLSERQLKFLSSQLLTVQENERKRIAAELHDNLGQILTAIKFGVENTLNQMDRNSPGSKPLESLIPTIQNAIEEVRRIYTHLRPSILDDLGIVATIGWFCREYRNIHPNIEVIKEIGMDEEDVPSPLKIVIYRIIQEAMTNVAKHSSANCVELSLFETEAGLELTINDNGIGFDIQGALNGPSTIRGLGLASMKERAELSGGNMEIRSRKGKGTAIRILWPPRSSMI
jgi:signal transduction histidine kinase